MKYPSFLLRVSDGCSFSSESVQTYNIKKIYKQDLIRLMLFKSQFPLSLFFLLINLPFVLEILIAN